MEREVFLKRLEEVEEPVAEAGLKAYVKETASPRMKDVPICIGELSELILELARFQRGKMDGADFLQELSHVQWAIWSLQAAFGIPDGELYRAVQASFRPGN